MQVNAHKPAAMLVLLIMAGALAGAGARRAASQEQLKEQPAQLRELAERLLARPFPAPGEPPRPVQLLPGQLPGDLPLDVPLLPGSRIVGRVQFLQSEGIWLLWLRRERGESRRQTCSSPTLVRAWTARDSC